MNAVDLQAARLPRAVERAALRLERVRAARRRGLHDDTEVPKRAAARLIDGLGVPAVIGFAGAGRSSIWPRPAGPKGVLALLEHGADAARHPHAATAARQPDDDQRSSMEVPAVTLIEVIERIRAGLGPADRDEQQVAMARIDNVRHRLRGRAHLPARWQAGGNRW
ncbi:MAG: hypothetical protein U0359_29420 [Byssovorax sp.]